MAIWKMVATFALGPFVPKSKVSQVNLQTEKLQIIGRRIFLKYSGNSKNPSGFLASPVEIEIALPPAKINVETVVKSVKQVFLSKDEQLADFAPTYWRQFLLSNPALKYGEVATLSRNHETEKVGDDKHTPPKIIYAPSPDFSNEARKAGYQGTVILSLVVNTEGKVEDISILKPLGMGLDDKAVEKVSTWKFKPGMRSGVPVPVRVQLDVTFRM